MMLRVREQGDELHIEVDGLAGRQQRVLQALTECRRRTYGASELPAAMSGISVRAGADMMRIRLKSRAGLPLEATAIYQCLRQALLERSAPMSSQTAA